MTAMFNCQMGFPGSFLAISRGWTSPILKWDIRRKWSIMWGEFPQSRQIAAGFMDLSESLEKTL